MVHQISLDYYTISLATSFPGFSPTRPYGERTWERGCIASYASLPTEAHRRPLGFIRHVAMQATGKLNNLILGCSTGLMWVVNRATLLSSSFCINVGLPFLRTSSEKLF